MTKDLKVSIIMLTYNHSDYIIEAIEGVLMQKTNFEFELIIVEDCSKDDTFSVVKKCIELDKKGVIRYFRHEQNVGITKNFQFALEKVRGEYIAICDGDDYWTNSNKLQMQVDYLNQNLSVNLVATERSLLNQKTGKIIPPTFLDNSVKVFSFEETFTVADIYTLTVVIRANCLFDYMKLRVIHPSLHYIDFSLWIFAANSGNSAKINIDTGVYRILENSATHSEDFCNKWNLKKMYFADFQILKHYVAAEHKPLIESQEYRRVRAFYIAFTYCGDFEYKELFKEVLLKNNDHIRILIFSLICKFKIMSKIAYFFYLCSVKIEIWKKSIIKYKKNDRVGRTNFKLLKIN